MRTLRIISVLGVLLSVGAGVYASMQYIAVSRAAEIITFLSGQDDAAISKIQSLLEEHPSRDFVVSAFKSRHEQQVSLYQAYVEMASNWKSRSIQETALWTLVTILFLLFMAKTHEKGVKPAQNN